jgi:four helix bundle protein
MEEKKGKNQHNFDLEQRTEEFAKRVIRLCRALPKDYINERLVKQVIGSSDSTAANYIEANDAMSKKDMIYRLKISRKEAKESKLHLVCIAEANPTFEPRMQDLIQEADELKRILSSIIDKQENSKS